MPFLVDMAFLTSPAIVTCLLPLKIVVQVRCPLGKVVVAEDEN
jgi:hypothetical protein